VIVRAFAEKKFIAVAIYPRSDRRRRVFCELEGRRRKLCSEGPPQQQKDGSDAAFLDARELRECENLFPKIVWWPGFSDEPVQLPEPGEPQPSGLKVLDCVEKLTDGRNLQRKNREIDSFDVMLFKPELGETSLW
jgi:hypothetical protein